MTTPHSPIWIKQSISELRELLLEALVAGKFLHSGAQWHPHHSGEILYFADRVFGVERPAVLVIVDDVTSDIVQESVESDFRSYIIIGGTLQSDVDLGKARIRRIEHVAQMDFGEHYWATFVLDDAILVTLGTALSWCRLVGELLNAQMPTPFVQRRICAECHALNTYHLNHCIKCGKTLSATGRL